MMVLWLLLPTLLYTVGIAVVALWRFRAGHDESPTFRGDDLPMVAVVIAARNEEDSLGRCLDALTRQDYPHDRYTIYVADDHSTDRTADVIAQFAADVNGPAVVAIQVPDAVDHLQGKALAIHSAIERSSESLLLMTDADCAPPTEWVRTVAAALDQPDIGVVWARTDVDLSARVETRHLDAVQALDWAYLLTSAGFLLSMGRPVTAMGNNMAFKRAAYEAVGGYPALRFSVTEDFELFKAIVSHSNWEARYLIGAASRVLTLPLDRLSEMYMQRRRWARGGLRTTPGVWSGYVLAHLAHLLPLVGLVVIPGPALLVLGIKVSADLALVLSATDEDARRALRAFPAWQAYLFGYAITLPYILLLQPRIDWKDRRH